ncbi:Gfo/Idh/MocA family protein [Aspergillus lucknowensis]|uniref:Quinate utilization oxidoreductase QutH n=1 Tax=Aspergillus lucknowensis TaxID=176173 RepID=A0ABR4LI19_9EURO
MNDSKIRVALVGGGTIAPLHAKCLHSSPSCTLTAIIDPFPPGRQLAAKLSVAHFDTVGALLASSEPRPDTYIICVPSDLHVPITKEIIAAASPKTVLLEKPFSTNSASGQDLVEFAEQRACTILVGHHRRHHPAIAAGKEAIQSGKLGTLTAISGLWTIKKPPSYFQSAPWRAHRSKGGGPIWINFVHDIDVIHYWTGSHARKLWAVRTPARRHLRDAAVPETDRVEEGAAITIEFDNGVLGTFLVSDNVSSPFTWEVASGENPLIPQSDMAVGAYRVFGTKGTISIPDGYFWSYPRETTEMKGREAGWHVPIQRDVLQIPGGSPFENQIEHLAKVVRGEEAPRCSAQDGLAAVRVCEAIVQALDRNDGLPILISGHVGITDSKL